MGPFYISLTLRRGFVLWQGIPPLRPGFWLYVVLFGVAQTAATLSLAKALRLSDISIVTALWKVSLLFLVVFAFLSLGESPLPSASWASWSALIGVYILNIQKSRHSVWAPLRELFDRSRSAVYAAGSGLLCSRSRTD